MKINKILTKNNKILEYLINIGLFVIFILLLIYILREKNE